MSFNKIFSQVAVLFLIIVVGYFIRKFRLLDTNSTSKIGNLTMAIFLPCMIINSMQIDYNSNTIHKIFLLLLVSIISFIISILLSFLLKFVMKNDKNLCIYQFITIFSNVSFMGYPITKAVLGQQAVFYTAIYNLPFNILTFTLGVYIIAKGNKDLRISKRTIFSPATVSVIIGLVLFLTRIKLPSFLDNTLSSLGNVTTPMSMIVIGSMLATSSIKECFMNKKIYFISILRLAIIPIINYLVLKHVISDPLIVSVPIVLSAMPAASNTAIMANQYGADVTLSSQVVFMTTLFSVITIPLISMLLLG